MFPVSLFFKGDRIYGVGTIKFDLVLSESHNFNSDVTRHPVEDGSEISDNIHNQLENGTLNGLISNYSLSSGPITTNRVQDVFDAMYRLWQNKQLVTITTVMRTYDDVVITSMPFVRDSTSGEAGVIQVNFQKVNVVKLQEINLELSVKVNNLDTAQNRQVSPEADVGQTVPEDSTLEVTP